jgi:hypothetical protein
MCKAKRRAVGRRTKRGALEAVNPSTVGYLLTIRP